VKSLKFDGDVIVSLHVGYYMYTNGM
jgi:hypothetical protein